MITQNQIIAIKRQLHKVVMVTICFVLVLCLLPSENNFGLFQKASAASAPKYDASLGTYSENNGVLTAKPYENCGFRGWFDSAGEEVSIEESFAIPSGATALDYTPVFYSYNLIENGDFEAYSIGDNLKMYPETNDLWDGCTEITVTDTRSNSGQKSARISGRNNTVFKTFSGLQPNTQYKLDFYYNLDSSVNGSNTAPYLDYVSVIAGTDEVDLNANKGKNNLSDSSFGASTGTCTEGEWKKVSLAFYTEENTSAKLCLLYLCDVDTFLYLDDLSLIKTEKSSPAEYINDDFSDGLVGSWQSYDDNKFTLNVENQKLKITKGDSNSGNYGTVQSKGFHIKKGCSYVVKFYLDITGITEDKVQEYDYDKKEYVYDDSGNPVYITDPNGFAFSLSNEKGTFGSKADKNLIIYDVNEQNTSALIRVKSTFSLSNNTTRNTITSKGFVKDELGTNFSKTNLPCEIEFTAPESTVAYFNIRINSKGTISLDNFSVEESGNADKEEFIRDCVKTVGSSIRTEGTQGLRYKTSIDKRLLTSEKYFGIRVIEYGTVAINSKYLSASELLLDTDYTYNGKTYSSKKGVAYSYDEKKDLIYEETSSVIHYTGVLINISESNFVSDYAMRSYIKYMDNGVVKTMYFEPTETSVYTISKYAYSAKNKDGSFVESEQTRAYLKTHVLDAFTDKSIVIKNNSSPISNNFQGITSTVYHGTIFFPDSHGRTYTDAQAAIEMDRLVDSKVTNVRTRFASQWMWTDSGWDWSSKKMQAFYKWAKMLDARNITITLNAGWALDDFIWYYDKNKNNNANDFDSTAEGHASIPEVDYLHGVGDAKYGEDANATRIASYPNLNLTDSEINHYSVAAARYAEWIKQALQAFKANGVNNIEYILPFTETGRYSSNDSTYGYDEWILMTMALHDALNQAGMRNDYKLIGPSQYIKPDFERESLVEYYLKTVKNTEFANMVDILSMHTYTQPDSNYDNTIYNPVASYLYADKNFKYFSDILDNNDASTKEFWCDEYFAYADDAKWWQCVGMQLTQFAAGLTSGINNGVDRFCTWQMFDSLWDTTATYGLADQPGESGEFIGGVHAVGTCPSLIKADGDKCNIEDCPCKNYTYSSYVPRITYYGINLIGKYMNNKNAKVYESTVGNITDQTDGGIYVSSIKNDAGQTVILVVNTNYTLTSFNLELESKKIKKFIRYTYDPTNITPSAEAKSIESDGTIEISGANSFRDMIPPQSFAIYVSETNLDTDLPMDE